MGIMNQFTIRKKLYLALASALVSIVAITGYSLNAINRVGNIINTINNHPFIVSNAATDSQKLVVDILRTYQEVYIENDISKSKVFEKQIEGYEKELDSNIEKVQTLIIGDEGEKLARETVLNIEKWKIHNSDLIDKILSTEDRDAARKFLYENEQQYVDEIQMQLSEILKYAENRADNFLIETRSIEEKAKTTTIIMSSSIFVILFTFIFLIIRNVSKSLKSLKNTMEESIEKDKFLKVNLEGKDEIVDVACHYNKLIEKLKVQFDNRNGLNELSNAISGDLDMKNFLNKAISFICDYTNSGNGVFYLFDEEKESLDLMATYAFTERQKLMNHLELGESLVGQVAIERKSILLKNIKKGEGEINSGIISETPINIIGMPLIYEGKLCGVIELSSFEPFDANDIEYLDAAADIVAVSIYSSKQRDKIYKLLDETQKSNHLLEINQQEIAKKAEELELNNIKLNELFERSKKQAETLQEQQEELSQNNEELEEQARALKESESKLQLQQEELRISNEELETYTEELKEQKQILSEKNNALATTQKEMVKKAEALEKANKYKSEFLANMSHELRTPLNSILVLSQLLASKKVEETLTEKEREFASTIHSSGKDLLTLINGVLDLSKVEAGKLQVNKEKVYLREILEENKNMFESMAEIKNLDLKCSIDKDMPGYIETDSLRLNQIIKNLLSNSIKFTHKGQINLTFRKLKEKEIEDLMVKEDDYIAIEVKDTGIGIPKDKMEEVFEAFKQSDGTTSRQYGGTGLGLTISLELAKLLGGYILHESEVNKGSKFILVIPREPIKEKRESNIVSTIEKIDNHDNSKNMLKDNPKDNLKDTSKDNEINKEIVESNVDKVSSKNEKRVLIIEDDPTFAQILSDLAEEKGYVVTKVLTGKEGIIKAKTINPIGIILDIGLPDIDGMILAKMLSEDESTKNIPIHVISGSEEISEGDDFEDKPKSIIGFLKKPVDIKSIYKTLSKIESFDSKGAKQILVVGTCGDEDFKKFTQLGNVNIKKVLTGKEAFEELETQIYGCIILDIKLSDTSGIDFMKKLQEELDIYTPIIIYTDEQIESEEVDNINKYAETIILKSQKSKERLIDEVSLFLHDVNKNSLSKRPSNSIIEKDKNSLSGIRVLLADDDSRNVFALRNLLERSGIDVVVAKDGFEAVKKFDENEIDLVLMDIMMPKMDGYEAIKQIREKIKGKNTPIIALTAKAMNDDRDKCISAGANDYLMKPVDGNQLLSMIKVWLS